VTSLLRKKEQERRKEKVAAIERTISTPLLIYSLLKTREGEEQGKKGKRLPRFRKLFCSLCKWIKEGEEEIGSISLSHPSPGSEGRFSAEQRRREKETGLFCVPRLKRRGGERGRRRKLSVWSLRRKVPSEGEGRFNRLFFRGGGKKKKRSQKGRGEEKRGRGEMSVKQSFTCIYSTRKEKEKGIGRRKTGLTALSVFCFSFLGGREGGEKKKTKRKKGKEEKGKSMRILLRLVSTFIFFSRKKEGGKDEKRYKKKRGKKEGRMRKANCARCMCFKTSLEKRKKRKKGKKGEGKKRARGSARNLPGDIEAVNAEFLLHSFYAGGKKEREAQRREERGGGRNEVLTLASQKATRSHNTKEADNKEDR